MIFQQEKKESRRISKQAQNVKIRTQPLVAWFRSKFGVQTLEYEIKSQLIASPVNSQKRLKMALLGTHNGPKRWSKVSYFGPQHPPLSNAGVML